MKQSHKKVGSGVVSQATPLPPANVAQPSYPPPPGYRIVIHCDKVTRPEQAFFDAVPVRVYREWLTQALDYVAEHPQITTNPAADKLAELPISA